MLAQMKIKRSFHIAKKKQKTGQIAGSIMLLDTEKLQSEKK